ncbi:MAG: S-adenosylmethionine decarboxylase family protein [Rubrivivax sp.]
MNGLHLTADLSGCACDDQLLLDAAALQAQCEAAVAEAGLQGVATLFHAFAPESDGHGSPAGPTAAQASRGLPASGVTGVVLLAESHLAVHTWPELRSVTLDVYVCNRSADHSTRARTLLKRLIDAFEPAQTLHHALQRGTLAPAGPAGPGLTPPVAR